GFRGVVDDDGSALIFFEERVYTIAKESGHQGDILDIAAEESLKRIHPNNVRSVPGENRFDYTGKEFAAGELLVAVVGATLAGELVLLRGEFEMKAGASDHFGEVASVVFGLDGHDLERPGRCDAESRLAYAPPNVLLDGG